MIEDDDDPIAGEVICCQGPPICGLTGDEAIAAQESGCQWCKRILVAKDGSETITDPARVQ